MTTATIGQTTTYLRELGYRIESDAQIKLAAASFQSSWRLGDRLVIDGVVGPLTTAALKDADRRRRGGAPTCSTHFNYAEFACRCGGKLPGCVGNLVLGVVVDGGELLRAVGYTDGLVPLSALRCPARNTIVKGRTTQSLHQWGAALDLDPRMKTKEVAALGVATGIGYDRRGLVKHVDFRGLSTGSGKLAEFLRPPNPTGSTLAKPARFLDV